MTLVRVIFQPRLNFVTPHPPLQVCLIFGTTFVVIALDLVQPQLLVSFVDSLLTV